MSVTVKVLNAEQEVARKAVVIKNELLVLEAETQQNYQLVDETTGLAPQNIITKRKGRDLIISLNDGDNNPDILIKNYYDANGETTNILTGQQANGKIYAYIPESGKVADAISVLAEEVSISQALGGSEIVGGLWSFNPWWIAAGTAALAGSVIAVSSGGSQRKDPLAEVEKLVKAAEKADKDLKAALAEAEKGGISPEERQALKNQAMLAEEAKKLADNAVKGLPKDVGNQETLQNKIDALTGIELPKITDADSDGQKDSDELARVKSLVAEAERADKEAKDALAKVIQNGTLSPEKTAELVSLSQRAAEKKVQADAAVKGLPENTIITGSSSKDMKHTLQDRVDVLDGIVFDGITDKDGDGIDDAQEKAAVEIAVAQAEAADKEAKEALAKAIKNNLITLEEKLDLEAKAQDLAHKKAIADQLVKALPDGIEGKEALQGRVDALDGITTPTNSEVNDIDADGKPDAQEKAEAEAAVIAAEAADKEAKEALAKASKDGKISAAEEKDLLAKSLLAAEKKALADVAVKGLPQGSEGKETLQDRVDTLDGIVIQGITDKDNDGIDDAQEKAAAEVAVAQAEAADKAAKEVLEQLTQDGLITPEDKAMLEAKAQDLAHKKAIADQLVKALPDGIEGKEALQGRVDALDGITSPTDAEINDRDNDGRLDTSEKAKADQALEKAKAAFEKAKSDLAQANVDKVINPTEKESVDKAINDFNKAKAELTLAIGELTDGYPGKAELTAELAKLTDIEPLTITDQDADGKKDSEELAEAKAAVAAAEKADRAAKEALKAAKENKLITPAEKEELDAKAADATIKKEAADKAVKGLPAGTEGKEGLQDLVDSLDGITPPTNAEINDADADDIKDSEEFEAAKALVKAAEDAQAEADKALVDANTNGNISQDEADNLILKAQAAAEKKAAANEAVKGLPNSVTGKEELQSKVDDLDGIVIPNVTDKDNDRIDDAQEKAAALSAVKAAEDADKTAKEALAKAQEGGLITPAEKADLDAKAKDAADKKALADQLVKGLPQDTEGKDTLQNRVDALKGITPPTDAEINDKDADGQNDTDELAAARAAVEAAEAAEAEADNALKAAQSDNIISQIEADSLVEKSQAAAAKKSEALDALRGVPASEDKDALNQRVDQLDGIVVPEVTDKDNNGKDDAQEKVAVDSAIKDAEAANEAFKKELAKVKADGLITPAEKAKLDQLKTAADKAKEVAEEGLRSLSDQAEGKDLLKDRIDALVDEKVPAVNDQDADGKKDSEELTEAQRLVKAAETAERKLEEALVIAKEGGISPAEKEALTTQANEAKAAKDAADAAVKGLPAAEAQKAGLQDRVNVLDGIEVPTEITDKDGDGKKDAEELAEAQRLVDAAETAERKLEEALVRAEEGGISPAEKEALTTQANAAKAAKDAADAAVKGLPAATEGDNAGVPANEIADLQNRVNALDGIEVPTEITDKDGDGQKDSEELTEAQRLVKAAETAERNLEEALVRAEEGGISPAEKEALTTQANEAKAAKDAADAAVKGLPAATEGDNAGVPANEIAGLQNRVNVLDGIEVPTEITDQDADNKKDSEEKSTADGELVKAKAAFEAAKQALTTATENQLVTPTEKASVETAIGTFNTAKAGLQAAINELPNGYPGKADLETELAKLTAITAPEVNDQDSDGKKDSEEKATADTALAKAKQAFEAAKTKLTEVNGDQLINPDEKAELDTARGTYSNARKEAENAIAGLPNDYPGKADLESELAKLTEVASPSVNDKDKDGTNDNVELEAARTALRAAEEADQAAKQALETAKSNKLITPQEVRDLETAAQTAATKKADAQKAVDGLPSSNDKTTLDGKVKALTGITPLREDEINDADADGKKDSEEKATADGELVKAKAAFEAAKQALATATENQLVTPTEKADVETAIGKFNTAKAGLQAAINELPNGYAGKADLEAELEKLTAITAPEVNDQDSDGKKDSEELEAARTALREAETADQAAKQALETAKANNLLTPKEVQDLETAAQTAATKKAEAQTAVNELPDSNDKTTLDGKVKALNGITAPKASEINDKDANDLADATEIQTSEGLITTAKEAVNKLKEMLAQYNEKGWITPTEKAELDGLKTAADTAKTNATNSVNDLNDALDGKAGLKTKLTEIPEIPEVPRAKTPDPEVTVTKSIDTSAVADYEPEEVEIQGHTERNATVKIYKGSILLDTITANDDGSFKVTVKEQAGANIKVKDTFTATAQGSDMDISNTVTTNQTPGTGRGPDTHTERTPPIPPTISRRGDAVNITLPVKAEGNRIGANGQDHAIIRYVDKDDETTKEIVYQFNKQSWKWTRISGDSSVATISGSGRTPYTVSVSTNKIKAGSKVEAFLRDIAGNESEVVSDPATIADGTAPATTETHSFRKFVEVENHHNDVVDSNDSYVVDHTSTHSPIDAGGGKDILWSFKSKVTELGSFYFTSDIGHIDLGAGDDKVVVGTVGKQGGSFVAPSVSIVGNDGFDTIVMRGDHDSFNVVDTVTVRGFERLSLEGKEQDVHIDISDFVALNHSDVLDDAGVVHNDVFIVDGDSNDTIHLENNADNAQQGEVLYKDTIYKTFTIDGVGSLWVSNLIHVDIV